MYVLGKLWTDEAGFVVSAELVLVATLLVLGMIVGLTILRNQVAQELGDLAQAFGIQSQGYWFPGTFKQTTIQGAAFTIAITDGSNYEDALDACQPANASADWAPSPTDPPVTIAILSSIEKRSLILIVYSPFNSGIIGIEFSHQALLALELTS